VKVLLLAPQPFFTERGTPIAVRALAEALCRDGHQVDLVVLHGGEDIVVPGLRIIRTPRPPFVGAVPIGFSPAKLACDVLLAFTAFRLLARTRYDVIHAVEEAVYPALLAKLFRRVPVIHDMDSLMVEQIVEKWPAIAAIRSPLDFVERIAAKRSDVVLAVCPLIAERAAEAAGTGKVFLLPDIATPAPEGAPPADVQDLRAGLAPDALLALYVGNLERYQGVDLLVEAMTCLPPDLTGVVLTVVGGDPASIAAARERAEQLGVGHRVRFAGPAPLAHLPWLLVQADVLCSPRLKGVNTPMKIYSYMAAARPVLATRIASHTQVLDERTAMLVEPAAKALAGGLAVLAADPGLRARLGTAAAARARDDYGQDAFEARLRAAYRTLPMPGGRSGSLAATESG
jgi:glycosyltransferase involved in cell wall biosynthesis